MSIGFETNPAANYPAQIVLPAGTIEFGVEHGRA
jgi:hypothetical protein